MNHASASPALPIGIGIGIIGAGQIGSAFARALARRGIPAVLSNSRGPGSLQALVESIGPGIRAGTREEAAAQPMVLVAVNWSKLPAALAGLPDFGGRIVIDANNPIEAPLFNPVDLHGRQSSEVFADLVPGARVVKAFNHLRPDLIAAEPAEAGGQRVLFLAGDDAQARSEVAALMQRLGFAGIDLGSLQTGARLTQFPGGPLTSLELLRKNRSNAHAAAAAGPAVDFDALLKANLERVFNERDDGRRAAAIAALFSEAPVMYEPGQPVHGRDGIGRVAGNLLKQFGPTFRFQAEGVAVGHHGMATLRWTAGEPGRPPVVQGFDTAEIVDGRINRLWVLIDPPATASNQAAQAPSAFTDGAWNTAWHHAVPIPGRGASRTDDDDHDRPA